MRPILLILVLASLSAGGQSLKVMSYNIRLDVASDGINQWSNRKEKLPALIRKYDPDLVGLQEALHHQLMDILKALPEYGYIGVGRDDGKEKGEYSAILYKKTRFEVISEKTSWLSETPGLAGSKSWDAAITRVLTRGRFKDKTAGTVFIYFNTHFDHIGKEARKNSAGLILRAIESERQNAKEPVIVTGDFNSEPTDDPYKVIAASPILKDARPSSSTKGTFCNFGVNSQECKLIDHIFYSDQWKALSYQVVEDNDGKNYPSDHLPVLVELKIE